MWAFTDDTGRDLQTERRPERVIAYARAGAALHDLGIRPVAVYGSGHDGDVVDPAKAGTLPEAGVTYLGPGAALGEDALRSLRPDLIVDVTYDGKSVYAVDGALAQRLGVPVAALAVAGAPLTAILRRFADLAATLRPSTPGPSGGSGPSDGPDGHPGDPGDDGARAVAAAERAVRAAVDGPGPLRVLALSAAGPDQVHLARPEAWPELRHLAELGVGLVDPGPGGASWVTTDWAAAARLRPDLILLDGRANAVPRDVLETYPRWRSLAPDAGVEPWSPETPPSATAHGRFFRDVAAALEHLRAKR
ncbi:ABC transporter substrate-binding protein [Streptomyces sp. NPDC047928]|uniref:ABC transporter substrate-binding protein n=1 Tax=unclassified Streptomyces TaxID=2593676 RepID=UPI003712C5C1